MNDRPDVNYIVHIKRETIIIVDITRIGIRNETHQTYIIHCKCTEFLQVLCEKITTFRKGGRKEGEVRNADLADSSCDNHLLIVCGTAGRGHLTLASYKYLHSFPDRRR